MCVKSLSTLVEVESSHDMMMSLSFLLLLLIWVEESTHDVEL